MTRLILVLSTTVLVLAACGGGGGGGRDNPPTPNQGFVDFTRSLAAAVTETGEPVDIDTIAVNAPDDTEPESVS